MIPVLNAGSSGLNFALFEIDAVLKAMTRCEIQSPNSTPHLGARISKRAKPTAKRWPPGAPEDFPEALEVLLTFIDEHCGDNSLFAVGRPVVRSNSRPVVPRRLMADSLAALEAPTPLDPLYLLDALTPMRAVLASRLAFPRVDVRINAADVKATIACHTGARLRGAAQ